MKKLVRSALFLGAGGVSMSRLALAYLNMDIKVYAYDRAKSSSLIALKNAGATISTRFNKEFLNVDICIRSPAIKDDNKFVAALKDRCVPIIDRAEALNDLFKYFKTIIAVAGTHGKSTTSALIYHILRESGASVSCHIGANVLGERFSLGDDYLVVEACEYNRSFLYLHPNIVVITNVEADHMDTYKNMFDLRSSFVKFVKRADVKFVFKSSSTKFLSKLSSIHMVESVDNYPTTLRGDYNQHNISLAVAVCRGIGVSEADISKAVSSFVSLNNRNEYIGKYHDASSYIDYAHHPTEIECFLSGFLGSECQVVFQPHTYSRTKYLLRDFIRVLSDVTNLIIYKEYPARETKKDGVSAYQLYKLVRVNNASVRYAKTPNKLKEMLIKKGKIAFVGAGNISTIAKNILTK